MRDYTKQNKAVFLSNGRCVFEADAPRHEAEIERELPEAPKSTQLKNCETCANSPWGCLSMCGYMVDGFDACAPELIDWRLSNSNESYALNDGADKCPGWKGKEE